MNDELKSADQIKDMRCPFCGKSDCAELLVIGDNAHFQYRSKCGYTSKLFNQKSSARLWYNTRGGNPKADLLSALSVQVKVSDNPTTNVDGRDVGGSGVNARTRAELQSKADQLNLNPDEMKDAIEHKTDSPDIDLDLPAAPF